MPTDLWSHARDAWPDIRVARERFTDAMAAKGPACESPEGAAEVYLALACQSADDKALALADAEFVSVVPTAIAHMRLSPSAVDEVQQAVRKKLLVGTENRDACILDYAGKGKLRGLVKVMAVRTALSLLRKEAPRAHEGGDALLGLVSPELDPELKVLKETYRREFATAFEASVRELSSRDRNILRLRLADGLTVSEVGSVYGVDRATVTRWLAKVRQGLLRATRKRMERALGIGASELDSVMRLIESRMDVSVQRMLQSRDE